MELAMREAASASTGTPAVLVIAATSLGPGFVMRRLLLVPVRGCAPSLEWPCSTPPDDPLYRDPRVLVSHLRRAAPQTGSEYETGSRTAGRSGWADRPKSAASRCVCPDRTTASRPAAPAYRGAQAHPRPCRPARVRRLRRDTSPARGPRCSAPR